MLSAHLTFVARRPVSQLMQTAKKLCWAVTSSQKLRKRFTRFLWRIANDDRGVNRADRNSCHPVGQIFRGSQCLVNSGLIATQARRRPAEEAARAVTVRLESVSIFYSFRVMVCCHRNDVCLATRLRCSQRLVSKEITGAPALFSQVIIGLRVRGVLSMRPLLGIRYSHPFTR
jgi:hypothetical protein